MMCLTTCQTTATLFTPLTPCLPIHVREQVGRTRAQLDSARASGHGTEDTTPGQAAEKPSEKKATTIDLQIKKNPNRFANQRNSSLPGLTGLTGLLFKIYGELGQLGPCFLGCLQRASQGRALQIQVSYYPLSNLFEGNINAIHMSPPS